MARSIMITYALSILMPLCMGPHSQGDWPTHRGNSERTGNVDNLPGPRSPRVLWVHRSQEHHVASPVVGGKHLFIAGLGAFNSSALHAFALDPVPGKQIAWSKTTPYLKLPVVSSPAIADGKMVFGDGMHQTDGAFLHCVRSDTGLPLWQLQLPGRLVHLEGSPTIAGGRVLLGGGNAGVVCVDLNWVTLEGKEQDLASVRTTLEKRWKELQAKFEEDKKKDPDFAIPPNEDSLPRASPRMLWQQGKDKWHVDASIAVSGDRVLVASSYLDEEKVGERRLFCLSLANGAILWQSPLRLNPWAGPTVAGNTVIVGSSSVRFDPKAIPDARGEIVAFDLVTGTEKWHRSITGGIVSPVCVKGGLAICTATDGKVRAYDVATGEERWLSDTRAPYFAGAGIAGEVVYTADLKGVVHALTLSSGKELWKLDLATDPGTKAPGMVYGSPIVHGGRLYLATCNLEGERARQPTVVVCIGDK